MLTIGVLALQGGVREHLSHLNQLSGVKAIKVKKKADFSEIDGLILPGGESTTIGRLLNIFDLKDIIIKYAQQGLPIWGTCAGMILLAKEIVNDEEKHLGLMDIQVKRNAYGSQLDSFTTRAKIAEVAEQEIPLTFIRAPYIIEVGPEVEVLLELKGEIVAAKENNLLVTSFHPELDEDLSFHRYFANLVLKSKSLQLAQ